MISRLLCLARVEPAKAVAEAEQLPTVNQTSGMFYHAARVCAVSSVKVKEEAKREQYAARSVALLDQAREHGYFARKAQIEIAMKDAALAPLRQRADFKKLIAALEETTNK